jgi:hypothetical protein
MGNIPPMKQLNRKLSVQVKLAISALALGNLLALPIIAPATNGSDEANSQFVCGRNAEHFQTEEDTKAYLAASFTANGAAEFMNPPGGSTNCADCKYQVTGQQHWCMSQLPYKCREFPFPKWEYKRTRTRKFFKCNGVTHVACYAWSSIEGSDCCSGAQTEPACGDMNSVPPVTLPECALAGE